MVQRDRRPPLPAAPPLNPATLQPVGPEDLAPIFPADLILQEVTTDRHVHIPAEVRDVYRLWRPTPMYRARRLEKALRTPGVSPAAFGVPLPRGRARRWLR